MRAAAILLLVAAVAVGLARAGGGALDPSFSDDGWLRTLDAGPYLTDGALDLALQPDGKILVVGGIEDGRSDSYFGVFRYTPDGRHDPSFAGTGWAVIDLGSFESARAVALQRDGRIVVAGEALCPRAICFALVRFTPDGGLDRSFGDGGVVRTTFAQCGCWASDVAVQPDGKIVAAGRRFRYGEAQDDDLFAVARYLPDGRLDPTFSGDGRASVDFGFGDDIAYAVAVRPDGKILVAGSGGRGDDFAVARLRPDGRLDRTFSGDGRATVDFGRFDGAYGLALQRDGRILAVGASGDRYIPPRIAVTRLRANGSLDRTFGAGGKRVLRPGRHGGSAGPVVQQPDGRIIVGGRAYEDDRFDTSDWLLVRYGPRGALDASFGSGGLQLSNFSTGADWIGGLAIQRDGKIVAAGSVGDSQALARYLAR